MKKTIIKLVCAVAITFNSSCSIVEKKELDDINLTTALEMEAQYKIVSAGTDKMEMYVHAGICAAAWAQAKDEAKYKEWKAIEAQLAKEAGLK